MEDKIDTGNWQGVSILDNHVVIMIPKNRMTVDEAISQAAWLICMAALATTPPIDSAIIRNKFIKALSAVQNS